MIRRFTGWHMLTILVAGFGVVIAVNFVMASEAIRTFGGTVVENSYVASQRYNRWLAAARTQAAEGWRMETEQRMDGRLDIKLSRNDQPVYGAQLDVIATHPLGRLPAHRIDFEPIGQGIYRSRQALKGGRWQLKVDVDADKEHAQFMQEVRG